MSALLNRRREATEKINNCLIQNPAYSCTDFKMKISMRAIYLITAAIILISCGKSQQPSKTLTAQQILFMGKELAAKRTFNEQVVYDSYELGKKIKLAKKDEVKIDPYGIEYISFNPYYFNSGAIFFDKDKKIIKIEVVKLPPKKIDALYSAEMFEILDQTRKTFGKEEYRDYLSSIIYYKKFLTEDEFIDKYYEAKTLDMELPKGYVHKYLDSVIIKANKYSITLSYNGREYVNVVTVKEEEQISEQNATNDDENVSDMASPRGLEPLARP